MTKENSIAFEELQKLLHGLGYASLRTESAWVCHQAGKNKLFFRLYRNDETVDERDLRITRKFLDGWGLLADKDFDAILRQSKTPA